MKRPCLFIRAIIALAAALCACAGARAANFTTATQQGAGANWTAAIWQGTSPTAGNTYECIAGGNPTRVRNPTTGGIQTFPGDSLQLNTNTEIRGKVTATALNFPGVGGNPGLILNGGNMDVGDNGAVFTVTGVILVQNPSSFTCGDNAANNTRGWIIAAEIRGSTNIDVSKYFGGGVPAIELTGANSPFTGTWIFRSGGFKATASGSLGNSNIRITPTNGALNAVLFEVMYDVNSTGSLTITNGGTMNLHQNCTWSSVTINGTPLTVGTHPYSELNASFPGVFSAGGSGSITVAAPAPPFAPLNISAVGGDTQVFLSWAPAVNAAGYFINRSSTSGGPYTTVGSSGTTNFTDTGLVNGTTNYYVIVATNNLGASTNSSEVVGIPNPPVVGITAVGGTNQVALNWSSLPVADTYSVLRANSAGGPFTAVASGLAGTSYLDTTVLSGRTYYYRISAALTGGGVSGQSATVSATTAPSAPVLNAVLFASTVIRVGWTSPDTANTAFFLERSGDAVTFAPLAATGNKLSFTNTGLTLSNTYYYRVQASNVTGLSAYSNIAGTNTPAYGFNVNFGSAPDASAGTLNSPTPPGYLNDTGGVFAARGNGFSYGWTTLGGTNLGRDTRWRVNPIAPDLRYDTLIHLMKSGLNNPSLSAFWEIEIPNGPYIVHIVAGDPDNADANADHFQFNVEGVVTSMYAPSATPAIAHWADFLVSVAVSDGRLTINSGPLALNNKISFVDIYPDIPIPPIISVNPQSQAVEENRPVTLSVTLSQGSPRLSYQWYFNNAVLPDATNRTLVFPHIPTSAQGDYYLIVTNYGGSATSTVATLTVSEDTTSPSIVSVGSLDGLTIGVCFNEELDPVNAGELGNYTVNNGDANITNVIRRLDGRSVALQLDAPISGPFSVQVFSMADFSGNLADLDTNGVVLGLSTGDIGNPLRLGSHYTCDNETIELVGGGTDIWNAADQFYFAWKSFAGNFDMRTRVTSLAGANAITKAAILARESTNADSRGFHVSVNPLPPGRDLAQMAWRPTNGVTSSTIGSNVVPGGIPNAWLRLQRAGEIFTGYHSTNGSNWTIIGQTNLTIGSTLLLGLGLTAHDTNLLATGIFSNFRVTTDSPAVVLSGPTYSNGTFSASFNSSAGVNYEVQFRTNLPPQCTGSCPPDPEIWQPLLTIPGDGTVKTFTDPTVPLPDRRFYRVAIVP